jgi:hypothetical protein
MRQIFIALAFITSLTMASGAIALTKVVAVPEIDAAGIPLAFTLLGGLIAIVRERRRARA